MDYIYRLLKKNNVGSFKKLGNNPSALTKFLYISKVLPSIDEYFITDKADGDRAFLLIFDKEKKYITSKGEFSLDMNVTFKGVFDCEYVNEVFYIFDVLEYNNENVSYKTFADRYKILLEVQNVLQKSSITHKPKNIAVKKFRELTNANYKEEISAGFAEKRPYKIDGLIFTQRGANYNNTQNLKWKPPEQLTIDFLYLDKVLWVGIDKKSWKQYGFPLPNNYARLIAPFVNGIMNGELIVKDYFPVPFECSLGNYSTKPINLNNLKSTNSGNLEKKIVELSWDKKKDSWIFHRIRDDREGELKSGHYYGNNYRVAEQTLQSALNPLTIDELVTDKTKLTKDFYFEKSDDSYKAVRKFNNYVKDVIIKQYKSSYVMDMASGKGQDLLKYSSSGVRQLLMLELDINAIDEIINRKYDILGKLYVNNLKAAINTRRNKDTGLLLYIEQMNLNNSWKDNASAVDKLVGVKKPGVLFCNFALHYMMIDKTHMENICAFINHFLDKGSEFIFTALNGEKVFDLIKKQPFKVEGRYLIELVDKTTKDTSSKFKGFEKINVLLPCSPTPYEEPLINLHELDKVFNKYNIIRIEHKPFDNLLSNFAEYKAEFYKDLSDKDKEFIGLYSYTVYKKLINIS